MEFSKLLEIQVDLNIEIGSYPQSLDDLCSAVMEECGEVQRARRSQWRWWEWKKKACSTEENLLEELTDVLHFVLTAIQFKQPPEFMLLGMNDLWERDWHPNQTLNKYLLKLQTHLLKGEMMMVVMNYMYAITMAGFTAQQVEEAFLEKAKVNHDRTKA